MKPQKWSSPPTRLLRTLPLQAIFQRVPGALVLLSVALAVAGPVYLPVAYGVYVLTINMLFLVINVRTAYGVWATRRGALECTRTNWYERYVKETTAASSAAPQENLAAYDSIVHQVIIPNFKEDIETLCETLEVLASHTRAMTQYRICLAMEAGEEGCEDKASRLAAMFRDSFLDIWYTVHPAGRVGEIRGKSSNVAWAAYELMRLGSGRRENEIITVMDADTCFAEDYFACMMYHYAVAPSSERRRMMFAPPIVFDRNASSVPVFVRVTDVFWSMAVTSNLFQDSPVKFPCSAYSVSMPLALATRGWDAGPESIGEDMHMFLKCFFETKGRVICKSVYSPASQCNVTSVSGGFFSGMHARYVQGVRHLWGGLDFGYTLRRTLYALFEGDDEHDEEAPVQDTWDLPRLATLFHRVLEAHIAMSHVAIIGMVGGVVRTCYSGAEWYEPSAFLHSVYAFCDAASVLLVPCLLFGLVNYNKYHNWCAVDRWATQARIVHRTASLSRTAAVHGSSINSVSNNNNAAAAAADAADGLPAEINTSGGNNTICPSLESAIVGARKIQRRRGFLTDPITGEQLHHLGARSQIQSARSAWNILDIIVIPISSLLYYVFPCVHAQLLQLFTNKLVYKVAGKPTLATHHAADGVPHILVDGKVEAHSDDATTTSTAVDDSDDLSDKLLNSPRVGPVANWEHRVPVN